MDVTTTTVLHGHRKLLADIGGTFAAKVALVPLTMASGIVIARVLQPAGKGVYTTVLTFTELLAMLASLGIGKAAIYYIARGDGGRTVRAAALWASLAAAAGPTALVVAAALLPPPSWFPDLPRAALLAAAPLVIVIVVRGVWEGFLRGEHRNHTVNGISVLTAGLFLATVAAAALAGELSPAAAITIKAATAAAGVAAMLAALGIASSGFRPIAFPRARVRALLSYGVPFGVVGLLQTTSYRIDYLLMQGFLDSESVGIYSIAVATAELLWFLPSAVGFVLFPRSAALSEVDARREAARLLRATLLLTAVGAIVIAVVASPLIRIVYGDAYAPAASPLRILLVGIVANVAYQVVGAHMLGRGHLRPLVWATAAGLVVNTALNVLLIPQLGTNGAALASAVSYSLTGALTWLMARRRLGVAQSSSEDDLRGDPPAR